MTKKKETISGPTPGLGVLKSRERIFTYAENKLLDQMTQEITEAWAKDLATIRTCQKKTLETSKQFKTVNDLLEDRFKRLNEILESNNFLPNLQELVGNQQTLASWIEDIRKSIIETQNKLDFPYVKETKEDIKSLREICLTLKEDIKAIHTFCEKIENRMSEKKKWWQFWRCNERI